MEAPDRWRFVKPLSQLIEEGRAPIQRVRQEHPDGCVVACYAMLTHQTFAEAMAEFVEARMWREDNRGLSSMWCVQRLTERGWWSQQYYPVHGHFSDEGDRDRFKRAPWPPKPWAPYHLVCVTMPNGFHSVVMLADGTVLDPFVDGPGRLEDYEKVLEVIGLLPPEIEARLEGARATLNQAYRERNELAASVAPWFDAWVGRDPAEPDWPVLYLQLPTGQVSYHFAPSDAALLDGVREGLEFERWDGHTQEERSGRLWRNSRAAAAAALRADKGEQADDDDFGIVTILTGRTERRLPDLDAL